MVNILASIFRAKKRNPFRSRLGSGRDAEKSKSTNDLESNLEPSVLYPLRSAPSMIITPMSRTVVEVPRQPAQKTQDSTGLDYFSSRYTPSTLKAAKKFKHKSAQSIFASILAHYDSDGDNLLDLQEATSAAKDYGITGSSLMMFLNMADWKNCKIEIKELSRMLPEMLRQTKSPEMLAKIYRHLCNPNGKMDYEKCLEALKKFNPRINQNRLRIFYSQVTTDQSNDLIDVEGFMRLFKIFV